MKEWNRKQFEKQKQQALNPKSKGKTEKKEEKPIGYPPGYFPGKPVSLEEAQAIERYDMYHQPTGSTRKHWVNSNGDHVTFSY